MTTVAPSDDEGWAAAFSSDLNHLTVPVGLARMMSVDDHSITNRRSHGSSLMGRSFALWSYDSTLRSRAESPALSASSEPLPRCRREPLWRACVGLSIVEIEARTQPEATSRPRNSCSAFVGGEGSPPTNRKPKQSARRSRPSARYRSRSPTPLARTRCAAARARLLRVRVETSSWLEDHVRATTRPPLGIDVKVRIDQGLRTPVIGPWTSRGWFPTARCRAWPNQDARPRNAIHK